MYLEFFGFRELPFSITPDTAFFMSRAGYQDALNVLLVALRSGEGFVKVTGEVGTGKTLLCRTLMNRLGPEYLTAYIPNPYLKPMALFLSLADELQIPYASNVDQHDFMKRLYQALHDFHRAGKRVVVCLDEVQAMPVETLETLRLLTNLETEKSKLLQVVLFGQPELDRVLENPSIRQLRQRITFSFHLLPLNRAGLDQYVRHRLAVAGYHGPELFTCHALDLLYGASGGIPRLVNILANKALMAAFGRGERLVDRAHVLPAIDDTADARRWAQIQKPRIGQRIFRWLYGAKGAMALAALLLTGLHIELLRNMLS
ncbi:MAG TPA: AAA family ATPase [Gammaproteobacteria bacterium]|nr:AAA family ATPase [Gammaproteobacteria bacterium]